MTSGEQFVLAMEIRTRQEAQRWMLKEIARVRRESRALDDQDARILIQLNLAKLAAVHSPAAAEKMLHLFDAVHPLIFQMTDEERRCRNLLSEFSAEEIQAVKDRMDTEAEIVIRRARGEVGKA